MQSPVHVGSKQYVAGQALKNSFHSKEVPLAIVTIRSCEHTFFLSERKGCLLQASPTVQGNSSRVNLKLSPNLLDIFNYR